MIMERVFLPCVASIRRPSCLASSRKRRMGEEAGLTMATIREQTTELLYPMFNRVVFCGLVITDSVLFKILNLFAALFKLGLEGHSQMADFYILGGVHGARTDSRTG